METNQSAEQSIINELRKQQDLPYAIIGGALAAFVGALIWAVITVATKYQIGYMAIGVGFLVGMSVRFFGAGLDTVYHFIGAFFALAGCMLGNLFSQVGFIADEQSLGYFETLTLLDFDIIISIFKESFNGMDLLFYAIGTYEGFKFAVRPIDDAMIQQFNTTGKITATANQRLRLPLVIGSLIIMASFVFMVRQGISGPKTFYHTSGAKMSSGEYVNGKEHGEWTYWSEKGEVQLVGNYNNGVEEGLWQWYNQEGKITRKGSYKNGLFDSTWVNYNNSGIPSDSGSYSSGRLHGYWKYYYEDGMVNQQGAYLRDKPDGIWEYFYPNGQLKSKGNYKIGERQGHWKFWYVNGVLSDEMDYSDNEHFKILNTYSEDGKPQVSNGNGTHIIKYESGKVNQTGKIINGKKAGAWVSYYQDGSKQEEGEFKDDQYYILAAWTPQGIQTVTAGNGSYASHYTDEESKLEEGTIKNGLREGAWSMYYQTNGTPLQKLNYKAGKLDGLYQAYSEQGHIYSEGPFKADKKEGEWRWYYENGVLQTSINYKEGEKEGVQIFWSETGKKSKEEYYKSGELIEEKLLTE